MSCVYVLPCRNRMSMVYMLGWRKTDEMWIEIRGRKISEYTFTLSTANVERNESRTRKKEKNNKNTHTKHKTFFSFIGSEGYMVRVSVHTYTLNLNENRARETKRYNRAKLRKGKLKEKLNPHMKIFPYMQNNMHTYPIHREGNSADYHIS